MGTWGSWGSWGAWGPGSSPAPTYEISGVILDFEGNGMVGITVNLTGDAADSTTTAAGGAYEFSGVVAGSYTVTPVGDFTPASRALTVVAASVTADFDQASYAVSGNIKDWEAANLSGVLVSVTGDETASDTTDASGNFSVDLPAGSYMFTPTKAGVTFNPLYKIVVVTNAAVTGQNFVEQVYAVSGNIKDWAAANLSGVLVSVTGDKTASDTTDASGNFSIDLPDGSYTLTPTKAGVTFNPTTDTATVSGAAVGSKDFVEQTYAVSGTIYDTDGTTPLTGVLVSITGDHTDSATTGAPGTYSFDLPNGSYTVTPTKDGESFTPSSAAAVVSGSAVSVDDMDRAITWASGPFIVDWDDVSTTGKPYDATTHPSGYVVGASETANFSVTLLSVKTEGWSPTNTTNVLNLAMANTSGYIDIAVPSVNLQTDNLMVHFYAIGTHPYYQYMIPWNSANGAPTANDRALVFYWESRDYGNRAPLGQVKTGLGATPTGATNYNPSVELNDTRYNDWMKYQFTTDFANNRGLTTVCYNYVPAGPTVKSGYASETDSSSAGVVDRVRILYATYNNNVNYYWWAGPIWIGVSSLHTFPDTWG